MNTVLTFFPLDGCSESLLYKIAKYSVLHYHNSIYSISELNSWSSHVLDQR